LASERKASIQAFNGHFEKATRKRKAEAMAGVFGV
jgi:hypothetical protein